MMMIGDDRANEQASKALGKKDTEHNVLMASCIISSMIEIAIKKTMGINAEPAG